MSNKIHNFLQKHKIGKLIIATVLIVISICNIYQHGANILNIGLFTLAILFILYINYPKWKFW
jgi:hypothetical protein